MKLLKKKQKKSISPKVKRTKTMAETIKEGSEYINPVKKTISKRQTRGSIIKNDESKSDSKKPQSKDKPVVSVKPSKKIPSRSQSKEPSKELKKAPIKESKELKKEPSKELTKPENKGRGRGRPRKTNPADQSKKASSVSPIKALSKEMNKETKKEIKVTPKKAIKEAPKKISMEPKKKEVTPKKASKEVNKKASKELPTKKEETVAVSSASKKISKKSKSPKNHKKKKDLDVSKKSKTSLPVTLPSKVDLPLTPVSTALPKTHSGLTKSQSGLNKAQSKLNLTKRSSKIGLPGGPVAGMIDVVFCCDTTGSMGSYLVKTKDVIKQIIAKIKNKMEDETIDLKFGFVAYRDHPPQDSTYVIKSKNLCDEEEILEFISNQEANGGGDTPEAVMDGLWDAAKNTLWRNPFGTPTLRYIIHIADAPPHGKEYSSFSMAWSDGCPCGITIEKIAHIINMREIHYRLIKVGSLIDKMCEVFKKHIINYDEIPLSDAYGLDIKVSDMIVRELLPDDPSLVG